MEPFVVRARPWYLRKRLLLTVTDAGLDSRLCGLIPWSAIRSLPARSGAYGRYLEVDVFDKEAYLSKIERAWLRRYARASDVAFGGPLLSVSEQVTGVAPEALRAEIEARAGRTFPH